MPPQPKDDTGSLEKARTRLYDPAATPQSSRIPLATSDQHSLPHAWEEAPLPRVLHQGKRHVRLASVFFIGSFVFFLFALGLSGYFFYYSGNSVSADKITLDLQGPTSIVGGDTVPFSLIITNKNPVALENATVEIDFPSGTRDATNVLQAYTRYTENLGTLPSGAVVTRSVKAIIFGGAGQTLSLPVSFSYSTGNSNSTFVKKSSYALAISSTPLSISVDTLAETVSGKPLTLTLTVRSNATIPLSNVLLTNSFPFGFLVTSSSVPLSGSSFLLGTIAPGATKTVRIVGTLSGQNKEQRVFHFSVGTANSANDQSLAVTYMTQDITVLLAAPFIDTTLTINGDTSTNGVIAPGTFQNVAVSYTNTLSTSVTNATITIALTGSAIDYNSVQTTSGFYNSADHTVIFNRDTDPALATLAPGASGIGSFTFSTLSSGTSAAPPSITLTISVSGTRVGQSNVPEQVSSTASKTVKVATTVLLTASSLYTSGPLSNSGPIPPRTGEATTYTILWSASNKGSTVAGGRVEATLPSYISYTGKSAGAGSFSYNESSRTVSWNTGDLAQGTNAQGFFQVSLIPSSSQRGSAPVLTSAASFSGYDRFAGVQVSATADPPTTETKGDLGYIPANASVQ